MVKSIDPFKNETVIKYSSPNKELIKEITNPIGQRTIITFDAFKKERKTEKKNPFGQTVAKEEKYYDLNANLSRQTSTMLNIFVLQMSFLIL